MRNVWVLLLVAAAAPAWAQTTEEIDKALKADQFAQPKTAPAPAPTPPTPANTSTVAPGTQSPSGGWAQVGRFFQSLNPDLSAIVDFAAGWYSQENVTRAGDDPGHTGFNAQEVELAFQAVVDPYFRADIFLTIPNLGGLEVEEAFLTTTHLPWNFQLKAGVFRAGLGRQNAQHLHLQDFTRRPAINAAFLGIDGLRAPGMELNWLVPRIPFYLLLAVSVFSAQTPPADVALQTFGGGKPWDFAYVATARAFFPTSDATSLYLGLNYAHGKTAQTSTTNCLFPVTGSGQCPTPYDNWYDHLFGADLYFKWKPPNQARHYFSLAWQTEFFLRYIPDLKILGAAHPQTDGGLYSQLVAQVARRWFVGLRGELLGLPRSDNVRQEGVVAGSITLALSEFSRLRAYGEVRVPFGPANPNAMYVSGAAPSNTNGTLFTQFEIAIGAHGAHPF